MRFSGIFPFVVVLLLLQSTNANWFTDLFHSSKAQEAHSTINDESQQTQKHKASWTHELIAAAAGFAAMRAWEKAHPDQQGKVHTSVVKEVLAGLAAAAVDNLIETKGLDWIDRRKAKAAASDTAHNVAKEKYSRDQQGSGTVDQGEF